MADDVTLQIELPSGGSEVIAAEVGATTSFDCLVLNISSTQDFPDIDENGCLTLHKACKDSSYEEVHKLLIHSNDTSIFATDNDGRTPLHYACEGDDKRIVQFLILKCAGCLVSDLNEIEEVKIPNDPDVQSKVKGYINCTDTLKDTPLNIACFKGHTEIVKLLLEHGADFNVTNNKGQGRTPLGIACVQGHTEVVKLLLKHKADFNDVTDDNGNTPLSNACKPGHMEIVELLLEHGANSNVTNNKGYTPLSIACYKGHTEIVKLLLEQKDTDVTICNKSNSNVLDVAVIHGQKDAAMAIVKSDKWENALRSYKVVNRINDVGILRRTLHLIILIICCCCIRKQKQNHDYGNKVKPVKHFTTPMRRIIKKMPDVAKVVFDRCCETKKSPYDEGYEITYNYEFIEDFDLQTLEGDRSSDSTMQNVNEDNDDQSDAKRSDKKWPPKAKHSSQNHCLTILANSPSADLLKHPLAATLLDQKWNKYGRIVYYTNLIFYFLFVILLTSYALTVHPPNSNICLEVFGNDTETVIEGSGNYAYSVIGCSEGRFTYVSIVRAFMIVYPIVMLLRELAQVIQLSLEYFTSFVNFIEVSLFISTIIFASVRSDQCYCTRPWQWQVGVIAVFLSWIALIVSIRKLPVVGIYVVMFIKIFNNFIKVVILALLLISAFAIPFYMMFYDPQDRTEGIRTPFITPWRTIIKTITMTMGEYEMDSILRQNNQRIDPDVQYPVVTFSLIIVFVVLMPILFLNLLTSLAVGDTEEIRKSADAYRRTLRVDFTLPTEDFLRSIARKLPEKLKNVKSWIKSLVTVEQKHKVNPNKKKKGIASAISKIEEYFSTDTEENVDEVKNKSKPLSEEMKDLRSAMDQLLAIAECMRKEMQGERGGGLAGEGEVRGLQEQTRRKKSDKE
ncbi:PREDICTED: transient receptor potential cation channel subfamily A member 1 homolog isoform X2 [Amphimedon queenslandica]|uniref:Ion transport domain-containing protein n=1 Tax=Amphimedon queenslandica TaxID=400682 RepID=A0AAN0JT37_AMPQE|nr:PREDICTED: transient receptor potential cation channel subfamily A member 1 homolog isoform X2 [Amphimedon queenslandica]|eukprot:XP_019860059.1 PREDICTED: transient receptor potential cation channel subfamily A member 1 homolog isoform X2 [Amphimedon queenslandica]